MTRFIGIDPATVTGFVALDEHGEVQAAEVIKGAGKTEKGGITIKQLVSLENQLFKLLLPGDEVVIEGVAPGTQKGITTGMIQGGLRSMIERKGLSFNIVQPTSVKKYVGVTGFKVEDGKKVRLEGEKEKKEAMAVAALQHFNYSNPNHNITDAYIIARIARNFYHQRELLPLIDTLSYQKEVVRDMLEKAVAK